MQYTGRKDKNGTLIYEGDIVTADFGGQGEVIFKDFAYYVDFFNKVYLLHEIKDIEVIGNIYEE